MGNITMNRKEQKQHPVFENLKNGKISQREAAFQLEVSTRWVRKKAKRYLQSGPAGLVHKNRGRPSKRRWSQKEADVSIDLLQSEWVDFGPTFASEKLWELKQIKVDKETLRQVMIKAGVWQPKKRRSQHRKRRDRREMVGHMVQLDGSPHDWFEGRADKCTLLVFIDDATSKILWLEFVKSESRMDVMKATKNYVQRYGRPHSFYVDFGSAFSVNNNNSERDRKTQWERAMLELSIEVKHAHSPQAKGRVERANGTLQDRLVKEMRLANISSMESANNFIISSHFIKQHNQRFAVLPSIEGDAHRPIDSHNLEDIFCLKEARVLANDYTVTYEKQVLQLAAQQRTTIRPKDTIIIRTMLDGSLRLSIRRINLAFKELNNRIKIHKPEEQKIVEFRPRKPCENSRRWAGGLLPKSSENSSPRRVD
jgi:hypothetical protein